MTSRSILRVRNVVPITVVIGFALAGCASGPSESASPTASSSPSENRTSMSPSNSEQGSGPEPGQSPATAGTPIILEIGGQEVTGELDDSATAASLVAQLPLVLTFDDFGGQEKIADLPTPLDLTGAPDAGTAEPSTIGYYVPDQRLILYYDSVGPYPGIVPIGSYGNVDAVLGQTAEFTVTLREAD